VLEKEALMRGVTGDFRRPSGPRPMTASGIGPGSCYNETLALSPPATLVFVMGPVGGVIAPLDATDEFNGLERCERTTREHGVDEQGGLTDGERGRFFC
jgi:hypothetical protein